MLGTASNRAKKWDFWPIKMLQVMSEACKLIFLIASVLKDPPELKFFKKSNCGPRYGAKRDGQSDGYVNSILH